MLKYPLEDLTVFICSFESSILSASMTIKFPCTFQVEMRSLNRKILLATTKNEVKAIRQTAHFNQTLFFETQMLFDKKTQQFLRKETLLLLNLMSKKRPDQHKLVGQITLDLAEIANTGKFSIPQKYKLEYCSVEASLLFSVKLCGKKLSATLPENFDQDSFSDFHSLLHLQKGRNKSLSFLSQNDEKKIKGDPELFCNKSYQNKNFVIQEESNHEEIQSKRVSHMRVLQEQIPSSRQIIFRPPRTERNPEMKILNDSISRSYREKSQQEFQRNHEQQKRLWNEEKRILQEQVAQQKIHSMKLKDRNNTLEKKCYESEVKLSHIDGKIENQRRQMLIIEKEKDLQIKQLKSKLDRVNKQKQDIEYQLRKNYSQTDHTQKWEGLYTLTKKEKEFLQVKYDSIESQLLKIKQQKQIKQEDLNSQIRSLKSQISKNSQYNLSLEGKVQDLSHIKDQKEITILSLEKKLKQFEAEINKKESFQVMNQSEQIKKISEQNTKLRNQVHELEDLLMNKQEEKKLFQKQLFQLKSTQTYNNIQKMQNIQQQERTIQKMQYEVSELKKENEQLKSGMQKMSQEISLLKKENEDIALELEKQKAKLENQEIKSFQQIKNIQQEKTIRQLEDIKYPLSQNIEKSQDTEFKKNQVDQLNIEAQYIKLTQNLETFSKQNETLKRELQYALNEKEKIQNLYHQLEQKILLNSQQGEHLDFGKQNIQKKKDEQKKDDSIIKHIENLEEKQFKINVQGEEIQEQVQQVKNEAQNLQQKKLKEQPSQQLRGQVQKREKEKIQQQVVEIQGIIQKEEIIQKQISPSLNQELIMNLKEGLKRAEQSLSIKLKQIEETEQRMNQLQQSNIILSSKISQLQEQLGKKSLNLKSFQKLVHELQFQNEFFTQKTKQLQNSIFEMKQQYEKIKRDNITSQDLKQEHEEKVKYIIEEHNNEKKQILFENQQEYKKQSQHYLKQIQNLQLQRENLSNNLVSKQQNLSSVQIKLQQALKNLASSKREAEQHKKIAHEVSEKANKQIRKLQQTILQTKQQLRIKEESIVKVIKTNSELKNYEKGLEEEMLKAYQEKSSTYEEVKKIKEQNEGYIEELNMRNHEIESLRQENSSLSLELESLNQEVQKIKNKPLQTIMQQRSQIKIIEDERDEKVKQNQNLKKKQQANQVEIQQLKKINEELKVNKQSLIIECDSLKKEVIFLQNSFNEQKMEIEKIFIKENEFLKEKIAELTRQLEINKQVSDQKEERQKQQIKYLKQQLKRKEKQELKSLVYENKTLELQKQISSLKTIIQEQEKAHKIEDDDYLTLQNRIDEKDKYISELQQKLDKNLKLSYSDDRRELLDEQKRVESISIKVVGALSESQILENKQNEATEQNYQYKMNQENPSSNELENEQIQNEKFLLQIKDTRLQVLEKEIEEVNLILQNRQEEISEYREKIQKIQSQLSFKKAEINSLSKQIDHYSKENKQLKDQNENLVKDKKSSNRQEQVLKEKLKIREEQLLEQHNKFLQMQDKLLSFRQKEKHINDSLLVLEQQSKRFLSQISQKNQIIEKMQQELNQKQLYSNQILQQLQKAQALMIESMDRENDEIKQRDNKLEKAYTAIQLLNNQVKEANQHFSKNEKAIEILQHEISNKNEEIEKIGFALQEKEFLDRRILQLEKSLQVSKKNQKKKDDLIEQIKIENEKQILNLKKAQKQTAKPISRTSQKEEKGKLYQNLQNQLNFCEDQLRMYTAKYEELQTKYTKSQRLNEIYLSSINQVLSQRNNLLGLLGSGKEGIENPQQYASLLQRITQLEEQKERLQQAKNNQELLLRNITTITTDIQKLKNLVIKSRMNENNRAQVLKAIQTIGKAITELKNLE